MALSYNTITNSSVYLLLVTWHGALTSDERYALDFKSNVNDYVSMVQRYRKSRKYPPKESVACAAVICHILNHLSSSQFTNVWSFERIGHFFGISDKMVSLHWHCLEEFLTQEIDIDTT